VVQVAVVMVIVVLIMVLLVVLTLAEVVAEVVILMKLPRPEVPVLLYFGLQIPIQQLVLQQEALQSL
jgi:hypothetical protein